MKTALVKMEEHAIVSAIFTGVVVLMNFMEETALKVKTFFNVCVSGLHVELSKSLHWKCNKK